MTGMEVIRMRMHRISVKWSGVGRALTGRLQYESVQQPCRSPQNRPAFRYGVGLALLFALASGHLSALAQGGVSVDGPQTAPSASSALTVQTGSQKVPAGTILTLAFNTPLDSRMTEIGQPFTASITDDFAVAGEQGARRVILPAGTVIRGRVEQVRRPSLFSRGGAIYLAFDHVQLPSGDLLPLTLNLSTENTIVKKGALYSDPGIGAKVRKGAQEGRRAFESITEQGFEVGKQVAGGLGSIVTVPAAVVGGAVTGGVVTTGKAAVAVVGRGESVLIKPGDTITVDFGGSFNLPAE